MTDKIKNKKVISKIALVLATVIWGTSFVVMKDSVAKMPVNWLLTIRFSIAWIVLAVVFAKRLKKINKKYLTGGFLMGLFLFLAYEVQTYGIVFTTPAKNAFLTVTYCVMVPFLYVIFFRKKLSVSNFIAAFVCLAGVGFISLKGGFSMEWGDLLSLLCGFIFAVHILVIEKFGKNKDGALISIIQFFTVSVLSLITAIITEKPPEAITLDVAFPLIYLGVFATGIGFLCQTFGQKYTPPTATSILLSLEAVFGVLVSVIMGYDKLSFRLVAGFLLIFISIIISEVDIKSLFKKRHKLFSFKCIFH